MIANMKLFGLMATVVTVFFQMTSGFVMTPSAFGGLRVSFESAAAAPNGLQMRSRQCDLLGKKPNRKARVVTFSHRRIHKVQQLNLQKRRLFWDEGNRWVRLRLCTKGIKTIDKYGLDKAAKKFGLDLVKFTA